MYGSHPTRKIHSEFKHNTTFIPVPGLKAKAHMVMAERRVYGANSSGMKHQAAQAERVCMSLLASSNRKLGICSVWKSSVDGSRSCTYVCEYGTCGRCCCYFWSVAAACMCSINSSLLFVLCLFCFRVKGLLPDVIPEDSASPVLNHVLAGRLLLGLAGLQAG